MTVDKAFDTVRVGTAANEPSDMRLAAALMTSNSVMGLVQATTDLLAEYKDPEEMVTTILSVLGIAFVAGCEYQKNGGEPFDIQGRTTKAGKVQ
jgi:hypothetical protein